MRFKVIVCARNAIDSLPLCLDYLARQTIDNFDVMVTDDASTDGSAEFIKSTCEANGWNYTLNASRLGTIVNQVNAINALYSGDEDDVIVILDGDDRFHHLGVLHYLQQAYSDDTQVTYGSYEPSIEGESFPATPYAYQTRRQNDYRWSTLTHGVHFNHIRTCRYRIFHAMDESDFKKDDGEWFNIAADTVMILPWLELANGRIKFIPEKLCYYTSDHPGSVSNVWGQASHQEALTVERRPKKENSPFAEWKEPSTTLELAEIHPHIQHFRRIQMLQNYARKYGLKAYVETGTADGSTTISMVADFNEIYTVEIDPPAYESVKRRLRFYPHVNQICGDSAKELPRIAQVLTQPALFWLDAHYCGGARGDQDCPIIDELSAIANSQHRHHIIIDDADLFGGMPRHSEEFATWPHVDRVKRYADSRNYTFNVLERAIIMTPQECVDSVGSFEWQ